MHLICNPRSWGSHTWREYLMSERNITRAHGHAAADPTTPKPSPPPPPPSRRHTPTGQVAATREATVAAVTPDRTSNERGLGHECTTEEGEGGREREREPTLSSLLSFPRNSRTFTSLSSFSSFSVSPAKGRESPAATGKMRRQAPLRRAPEVAAEGGGNGGTRRAPPSPHGRGSRVRAL